MVSAQNQLANTTQVAIWSMIEQVNELHNEFQLFVRTKPLVLRISFICPNLRNPLIALLIPSKNRESKGRERWIWAAYPFQCHLFQDPRDSTSTITWPLEAARRVVAGGVVLDGGLAGGAEERDNTKSRRVERKAERATRARASGIHGFGEGC